MQGIGTQTRAGSPVGVEVYEYPGDPGAPLSFEWESGLASPTAAAHEKSSETTESSLRAEFDRRLAEETRRAFDSGREKGKQEGRTAEREAQASAHTAAEERRIRQAAELIENFTKERDRYLLAVEREVVDLALAIAARILRREAQMDPLLLTGAVRVALGQLIGTTQVRLLVPAAELDLWTESISLFPNLAVKPVVVAGDGMRLGECVIETELGTADLGIRAQLGEIERGFFDRVGVHEAGTAAVAGGEPEVRR